MIHKKDKIFVVSFAYISLPEFSKECYFGFNSDLLLRDMFGCILDPKNQHHYEYPKFQNFTYDNGCQTKYIKTIVKHFSEGKEIYLIFRTGNRILTDSTAKRKLIGYFKINKIKKLDTFVLGKKQEVYSLNASEIVLVSKKNAIDSILNPKVAIYSTNPKYEDYLFEILKKFQEMKNTEKNLYKKYQKKTQFYMNFLQNERNRQDIYIKCKKCKIEKCYLRKTLLKLEKIYSDNYLDYIYHPKVYLTNFIDGLLKEKKYSEVKILCGNV